MAQGTALCNARPDWSLSCAPGGHRGGWGPIGAIRVAGIYSKRHHPAVSAGFLITVPLPGVPQSVSRLLVQSVGVSLDGYAAGPDQDLEHPLGVNGPDLMEWFFPTNTFKQMHEQGEGETGVDNEMAKKGFDRMGA